MLNNTRSENGLNRFFGLYANKRNKKNSSIISQFVHRNEKKTSNSTLNTPVKKFAKIKFNIIYQKNADSNDKLNINI